jgi:hypothetical protein
MNILFLSLLQINSLGQHSIYTDLLREFVKRGHFVRIVSPTAEQETADLPRDGYAILRVKTPQIAGVGLLKKGIGTMVITPNIKRAMKRFCAGEHYDLVLYPTPPITLAGVVEYIKRRDHARTYLLLKDIFPQNAVDVGILKKSGLKGLIYRYFRAKEKKLYAISDRIGCMSRANVDYLLRQDPEIDPAKVEICPNSVEPLERTITAERRWELREKYGIPQDKTVFLYGGNLGRPQGVPFIMDCLRACRNRQDCFFFICGSGTEFPALQAFAETEDLPNVKVLSSLPHDDYEDMVPACDVGLLFLDCRFTIPNFPSRLLSYMQARLPVLCCTDPNTDVGDVCQGSGFGWKCLSNDVSSFCTAVDSACAADREAMGAKSYEYLLANYTAEQGCRIIMKGLE